MVIRGMVSVVIPTFNRAYCLPAALASLQRQTHTNWEAVVVDDGSTDDTPKLLARLSSEDSRIKVHRQSNGGVSSARNSALELVSGEWVGFLDSDDEWEPWKLAAQLACFAHLPEIGMVCTDMAAVDSTGAVVAPRFLRRMYRAYAAVDSGNLFQHQTTFGELVPDFPASPELASAPVRWGEMFSAMLYGNLVHTSTALVKRERLQAVGTFNESFRSGEDYEFHLRTCREGPIALLDLPSIRYRIGGGSDQLTARRYRVEMAKNALLAREQAIANDRKLIKLSNAELARIESRANCWVAEELFDVGRWSESRRYFFRALPEARYKPKLLAKALLVLAPDSFGSAMLKLRQRRV